MAGDRESVVVVTGGTSGIGRAVLEALLAGGRTVVALDVDGGAVAAAHAAHAGGRARFLELDVASESAVEAAIEAIEADIGPIAGVVNSAGIGRDVPCLDTGADLFRRILDVNLVGSFLVAREAARRMVTRRIGSIVNIASVSGIRGNAGRVAYGASKGGVITMTRVMAVELARHGVRVNAVAPGPVETAMVKGMHSPAVRDAWRSTVPQARYGEPEEIAGAVLFLLDDGASRYVTGQTICVDGGFAIAGIH